MQVKEKIGEGIYLDLRICDNLELMAEIKDDTIDLIYCDILYGTGRKFADYQDLKPIRSEIKAHYIPRIKEMHRILKPNGSIYLQMDYRIVHWIRCLLDDVFGYDNFVNEIIWCYTSGNPAFNHWTRKHDNILFYAKSENYTFNVDAVREQHRSTEKLEMKLNKNGKLSLRKNEKGRSPLDWWDIPLLTNTAKERNGYYSQKPKQILSKIIMASSNEGDLVADFYSGSFTTAEVCKDLKRNFIGCDINPNCFEKAKERGLFSFTDLNTKLD
jgi:site-specific DNA-methyltransferase (adenine-specific)